MLARNRIDRKCVSRVFISRSTFPSAIYPGQREASDKFYWMGDVPVHPVFLSWNLSVQTRFKVDWGLQVSGYHLLQSLEIKKMLNLGSRLLQFSK